ncbi:MAG: hypothetical protein U0821_25960 [Chloroflexota bacterium]
MQFYDHDIYHPMDFQQSNGPVISGNKLHIRFKEGVDIDPSSGTYTAAATHRDMLIEEVAPGEFEACAGHIGTQYDASRNEVRDTLSANHPNFYAPF